jgi:hypothetical protein
LYPMEMYRSKPISHYFRAVYFHPIVPLYPMATMYRSKPISRYFRAVYFHPRYTIVSYGNVQVRTHFTLFQGCIFSSKLHHCILWKCSGPNPFHAISGLYILIQSTVWTHGVWTQFYNYRTIQEAQLEFGICEQLFCTWFNFLSKHLKTSITQSSICLVGIVIYMTPQTREVLFWWF